MISQNKIMNIIKKLGGSGLLLAACPGLTGTSSVGDFFNLITCLIVNSVVPLLFALATVAFVWGIINYYLINQDNENKKKAGKSFMIWGLIALFVMLTVWGLVGILSNTFFSGGVLVPQFSQTIK